MTLTPVELPILMVTAKNQNSDVKAGFDSGANDYLTKPIEKKEILARVNTLLNLKKAIFVSMYNAEKYSIEKQHREVAERLRTINNELTSVIKSEKVLEKLFEITIKIAEYDSARAYIKKYENYDIAEYLKKDKKVVQKKSLDNKERAFINEIIEKREPVLKNIKGEKINYSEVGMPVLFSENILGAVVFS